MHVDLERQEPVTMMSSDESGLQALWRESERRLYPLATTSPERYERVVRIARRVADDLSSVSKASELTKAWSNRGSVVEKAAAALSLVAGDLPVDDLAGVGFALRDAEIRATAHEQAQTDIVAAAREQGNAWARLHETGDLSTGLASPYQTIDLHLESGAAIVAAVESNPMTAKPNHVLTVIKMDPVTAAPVDIDPGIAEIEEHDDPEAFLAARDRLVTFIEER